jgi:hypothetical protein
MLVVVLSPGLVVEYFDDWFGVKMQRPLEIDPVCRRPAAASGIVKATDSKH